MFHYVDNRVATSGTGGSWSSAWKNFSDIKWVAVQPGDTIYVSGGLSSQTYNNTLTIGRSGSAAGPITITKGVDGGHNGTVIIDGNNKLGNGIYDNGYNYVVIDGLSVRNITDA